MLRRTVFGIECPLLQLASKGKDSDKGKYQCHSQCSQELGVKYRELQTGKVEGDTLTGKSKNAMGEFDMTGTKVG